MILLEKKYQAFDIEDVEKNVSRIVGRDVKIEDIDIEIYDKEDNKVLDVRVNYTELIYQNSESYYLDEKNLLFCNHYPLRRLVKFMRKWRRRKNR